MLMILVSVLNAEVLPVMADRKMGLDTAPLTSQPTAYFLHRLFLTSLIHFPPFIVLENSISIFIYSYNLPDYHFSHY